jgi:hypothetical protein
MDFIRAKRFLQQHDLFIRPFSEFSMPLTEFLESVRRVEARTNRFMKLQRGI